MALTGVDQNNPPPEYTPFSIAQWMSAVLFTAGDGTEAAPGGHNFDGEITTGLYRPASGEIGVSLVGSEAMRFKATGIDFKRGQRLDLVITTQTTGDVTLTIPDMANVDMEIVLTKATQTLTNKTFTAPTLSNVTLTGTPDASTAVWSDLGQVLTADIDDGTLDSVVIGGSVAAAATVTVLETTTSALLKAVKIQDTSADHKYIFAVSELVADRTVTLPLLTGNDTFVFEAFAATLTNKTMSAGSNTFTFTKAQLSTAVTDGTVLYVGDITIYTDAQAITAVQGEATLDLAGDVTIAVGKTLSVDVISEKGSGTGVTIDSVLLKDGLVDGIDVAARDHNSVTLSGSLNYITISTQVITLAAVDLTTDVTGALPIANTALVAGTGITLSTNTLSVDTSQTQVTALGTIATGVWEATDVAVLHGGTGSSTAGAARTALGVDPIGTDNSTNVSLAGTPDYITISGQIITRGLVVLTTDISGILASTNGGTGTATYTKGDILFSSATNVLSLLAVGSDTEVLTLASGVPTWAAIVAAAHASSHQNGGGDEITVVGLSGLLADDQHILDAEVDTLIATHTALGDAHHNEAHTVASHSDTSGTGAELNSLTDGSEVTLHTHAGSVGITEADQWRLTTAFTGDATPIATNLERVDTDGFGKIGTGMSESSGIFTFPSTGFWFIEFNTFHIAQSGADLDANGNIQTTEDDSSYGTAAVCVVSLYTTNAQQSGYASFLFDVTSVTTHKVRFTITGMFSSNTTHGNTGTNYTFMTFTRLGST